MKKMSMIFIVLICLFVLASCGSSPPVTTTGVSTPRPTAPTVPSTPTAQPAAPSQAQPTATPTPPVVHLHVGAGVQLVHFYITVTRAELKTVQAPPPGMTYLLVTARLRNTTNVDRPLLAANFILYDANGKAYFAHVYSSAPVPPYGVVKPGATVLGPLIYLIPLSQTNYTFTYQWTGGLAQASWDIVTFPTPLVWHLQVTSVGMSVTPRSIADVSCGTNVTVTYTAIFHVSPKSAGGTVRFNYTVNNGRGQTPASITFSPGQTTKSYTFTWSGALPIDHTYPGLGGVQVTSPNQLTSPLVAPTGTCS